MLLAARPGFELAHPDQLDPWSEGAPGEQPSAALAGQKRPSMASAAALNRKEGNRKGKDLWGCRGAIERVKVYRAQIHASGRDCVPRSNLRRECKRGFHPVSHERNSDGPW
jgi:hypothetical protein